MATARSLLNGLQKSRLPLLYLLSQPSLFLPQRSSKMATATNNLSLHLTTIDDVKKIFNRFDTNGDGQISAEELVHVMKALGSDISGEEVKQVMTKIDTDCDGFINLEEFAGFCKENENAGGQDGGMNELHEAFDLYDLNKNGLISSTELHQILTRLGERCTVEDCVKMINSVDYDGDGYVDPELGKGTWVAMVTEVEMWKSGN